MPRLFRESPAERRSGRARATSRPSTCCGRWSSSRQSLEAFFAEVGEGADAEPRLDAAVAALERRARRPRARSRPAPAGSSSGWRWRCRPRCWSASATRPSPTPSAPPASTATGAGLRHPAGRHSTSARSSTATRAAVMSESGRCSTRQSTGSRSRRSPLNVAERPTSTAPTSTTRSTSAMFEAVDDAIDEVVADSAVRPSSCRAGRTSAPASTWPAARGRGRPVEDFAAPRWRRRQSRPARLLRLAGLPTPVIAAVHGNCIGGGAQFALGADIGIVRRPDGTPVIREMTGGLIPDMGITRIAAAAGPLDVAKELVLTGADAQWRRGGRGRPRNTASPPTRSPRPASSPPRSPAVRRTPPVARRRCSNGPGAAATESLALEEELQRELLGPANQLKAVEAGMGGSPGDFDDPA